MRPTTLLLLLLSFLAHVNSQNSITLTGRVVDAESNEPLEYATIASQTTSTGTVTNSEGAFTLTLESASETDSIFISYIGYVTIGTTIAESLVSDTYSLAPESYELEEAEITSDKFNLNAFVKDVIVKYNKNRRQEPHIAIAHYREKAEKEGKYIMYMESIGYSLFAGKMANAAPLSNYKFFCENTRCYVKHPDWLAYAENTPGQSNGVVAPSGGANLNVFRYIELEGVLSKKDLNKHEFKLDSSYVDGNNAIYRISFEGKVGSGVMDVYADTKEIVSIQYASDKYWANAFQKRLEADVHIRFGYFEGVPFISNISAQFDYEGLMYFNDLQVLVQKYDNFKLDKDEYWSLNSYDRNPFIQYDHETWEPYMIEADPDYPKVLSDLSTEEQGLEEEFAAASGRWFFSHDPMNNAVSYKVSELKRNF